MTPNAIGCSALLLVAAVVAVIITVATGVGLILQ